MCREVAGGGPKSARGADRAVAELALRQHGPVSAEQLREAGLRPGAIQHRVREGRLHRRHRGVYVVGHPRLDARGRQWAAVLACGGPALAIASHRSAGWLHDLAPEPATPDVATLRSSRPRAGIRVHRLTDLDPQRDIVTEPDGLRTTTVPRTLIDLATVLSPHRLERVMHRAEMLGLLDARGLDSVASRPGAIALRTALATLRHHGPDLTRSQLEELVLELVHAHGLPRPRVNAIVLGYEVDFWWPDRRLVVEVDGAAHRTRKTVQNDHTRDNALTLAGITVLRFTYADVRHRAADVVRQIRAGLH